MTGPGPGTGRNVVADAVAPDEGASSAGSGEQVVQGQETAYEVPVRSRGVISLVEENCTVCMLCARECPDWCIHIEGHTVTQPADEVHRRPRTENVLDRFAIDFSLCLYCGICIEVCPFDALHWSPEHDYAGTALDDLTHERARLTTWEATAPTPARRA